ncbi:MAG: signal peptidase I [Bacteroidota bacterium]
MKKYSKKKMKVFTIGSLIIFILLMLPVAFSTLRFRDAIIFFLFSVFMWALLILITRTKKSGKKKRRGGIIEWVDAIIFAVIAATLIRMFFIEAFTIPTPSMEKSLLVGDFLFVSKISYGAKTPNTPLSFPFAHHTLPFTENTKSYLEWIKMPYYRIPGFSKIKNNDVVVFNYPMDADPPLSRPVDKCENYIKRCVGIPGDTLQVINKILFINGSEAAPPEKMQFTYDVKTDGSSFNPKVLEKMDVTEGGRTSNQGDYRLVLTDEAVKKVRKFSNVRQIKPICEPKEFYANYIFPSDTHFQFNKDNFGPIVIPQKGTTINLTIDNLPLYLRLITVYENNKLEVKDEKIFVNGVETTTYTFKMDYYFMMGDNRDNSADSRFWGFVPEDHIVGKAVFIWFSINKKGTWFNKIRWGRLFSTIK